MTFYEKEVLGIKKMIYANEAQIKTVIRARHYIDTHLENELSLDILARIHYTSKYHLLRLFKRYYGQTPKQYSIEKRIERSKELLKEGIPVNETCFLVGFESRSSFSTLFKNKTGMAPVEFQKSNF